MYDVIVIGSDLSSLIAALLAARYGRKTLLVSESGLEDCLSRSGYVFNIDPFPWSGFGLGQVFSRLLSELNIPLPEPSRASPLNPALQVILPEHRIDFFLDRDALLHDLGREYPGEEKQLQALYQSVAKVGETLERAVRETLETRDRSLKGLMKSCLDMPFVMGEIWRLEQKIRAVAKRPSLGAVFDSEFTLLSNLHVNHAKPLSSAYLLSLPWRGLYYHFGGKHRMLEQLRKRYEDLRGETLSPCAVEAVRAGGRIEVDIRTKGKPAGLLAQRLVISTKSPALEKVLSSDGRFSRLARRLRKVETRLFPFTLHLGVDNRGLPDRMGEYVIHISEPSAEAACPFLFLEANVADDTALAPPGKRTLAITALLPRSPVEMANGELAAAADDVLLSLEGFLPFLRESIEFMDLDGSIDVSRRYQQVVNPRYRFTGLSLPGLMTFPVRSHRPNVLLTGGMTFAGLGFEGEVLSGMKAGQLAAGDSER
ncbi:MAG: NAD(P)/FAD-dependent oxidoreductase [Syntrophaceae bacterium]|nr:NAD(P)/FAD-dependent oxidoreductase [Syntrophaceae bacterium]